MNGLAVITGVFIKGREFSVIHPKVIFRTVFIIRYFSIVSKYNRA